MSNKLLGEFRDAANNLVSAYRGHGRIWFRPGDFYLKSTGAPLAAFVDGASDVPGLQLGDSKSHVIRWNNHAAPLPVMAKFAWPDDLDASVGASFVAQLSKSGNTLGDATSLTIELWNQVNAALHDADTDFGGATGALTGNATAKTIAAVTRAIALGDLPATTPASGTLTIKPTAGLLGTDDLFFHEGWIFYTKKAIA